MSEHGVSLTFLNNSVPPAEPKDYMLADKHAGTVSSLQCILHLIQLLQKLVEMVEKNDE